MPRNPLLVAVPTYNEKENIQPLLDLFDEVGMELDILFVDDNSHDGTAELIEEIQKVRSNVFLIRRRASWGSVVPTERRCNMPTTRNTHISTMDADLTTIRAISAICSNFWMIVTSWWGLAICWIAVWPNGTVIARR